MKKKSSRMRVPPEDKMTAKGKFYGRPLKWTDELIEVMADKILDWVQHESNSILLDFCNENGLLAEELTTFSDNNMKFSQALKLTKQTIARRREQMVNREEMNYGVYQRYQAMYDPMLHKYERDEKTFDAELKKQIINSTDGNLTVSVFDYSKA